MKEVLLVPLHGLSCDCTGHGHNRIYFDHSSHAQVALGDTPGCLLALASVPAHLRGLYHATLMLRCEHVDFTFVLPADEEKLVIAHLAGFPFLQFFVFVQDAFPVLSHCTAGMGLVFEEVGEQSRTGVPIINPKDVPLVQQSESN